MVANARHICKTMIISQETSSTADLYEGVWIRCCTNSHQLGRSLTLWLSIIGPGDPKLLLIQISVLFCVKIYVQGFYRAEKKSGPSLFCAPALYLLTMCFPYLWQNLTLKVIRHYRDLFSPRIPHQTCVATSLGTNLDPLPNSDIWNGQCD